MGKKHVPFEDRLNKITHTGCWEWTGGLDKDGYGHYYDQSTRLMKRAHRIAWKIYKGEIPIGVCVLHKCDNRKCVNPSHLFLGTVADNNRDRDYKGRTFRPFGNKRSHGIKDSELPWKVGQPCKM